MNLDDDEHFDSEGYYSSNISEVKAWYNMILDLHKEENWSYSCGYIERAQVKYTEGSEVAEELFSSSVCVPT